MVDESSLNIEPIEEHNIVEHLKVSVLELMHIGIVEIDNAVGIQFFYLLCHTAVADRIAVTPYNLCVSVAFWVIGHSEWCSEVDLPLLEVITEGWVQRQISVW